MYKGPEHYLNSDAAASRVMTHARLILKLSRHFEAVAPTGLRHSAHVANYESGIIIIHADNGAVATKIRQMSQRLCNELSKKGAQCSGIEVKVQPQQTLYQSTTSTPKSLSKKAVESLRSTTQKMKKGPLQDALNQLLNSAAKAG